jgi:hypothetical protein
MERLTTVFLLEVLAIEGGETMGVKLCGMEHHPEVDIIFEPGGAGTAVDSIFELFVVSGYAIITGT